MLLLEWTSALEDLFLSISWDLFLAISLRSWMKLTSTTLDLPAAPIITFWWFSGANSSHTTLVITVGWKFPTFDWYKNNYHLQILALYFDWVFVPEMVSLNWMLTLEELIYICKALEKLADYLIVFSVHFPHSLHIWHTEYNHRDSKGSWSPKFKSLQFYYK